MYKWKGSLGMKAAAWVAITLCAILFMCSMCGAVLLWDGEFYEKSEQELREDAFSSMAYRYSKMALLFMSEEREYDWDKTNFRYGIIRAEERGDLMPLDVDFNDPGIYVQRNFTEEVSESDLYMMYDEIGEDTYIYYSESLFGRYGAWSGRDTGTYGVEIDGVCYDEQNDTYYYETRLGLFPITDEQRYVNDRTFRTVDAAYLEEAAITDEENYYVDGDTIYVNFILERTPYWVVSILPENVAADWHGDLFEQANAVITLGWTMRYYVYLIIVLSFAAGVALFVFLMSGAGHRKNQEEIVATWLDRIPLELYIAPAVITAGLPLVLGLEVSYYMSEIGSMIVIGVCALCEGWLVLLSFLTLSTRIKLGKWWQNTLIWRVYDKLAHAARLICRNLSLFGKALLVIGGLAFLEFMGIYVTVLNGYNEELLLFLWFVEKILLAGATFITILQMKRLKEGGNRLAEGDLEHRVDTTNMFWEFRAHGESLNSISAGMSKAVDERMKSERFKTELITNVSHDIKTPLTSIINYVDLLSKEDLEDENAIEYIEVLERQSGRLKKLIEDLMEASKASTGNLAVDLEQLEAGVFMVQTVGEFEEKLQANELELLIQRPKEPVYIMADSRHFWRVIDNLMNNICKYAQPGTRVYINLEQQGEHTVLTFRNTSKYPLNITSEELMERFVRGDSARNTEGSGLGLSIAKSLMELMGGGFKLHVDGDLFKVVLIISISAKKQAD